MMNLADFPTPVNNDVPAGFDPAACPILAEHWPGLPGPTAQVRRAHLTRHLHLLGERAVYELLTELIAEHDISDDIDARLERYGELDAETVALVGGRHIPPSPLLAVPR